MTTNITAAFVNITTLSVILGDKYIVFGITNPTVLNWLEQKILTFLEQPDPTYKVVQLSNEPSGYLKINFDTDTTITITAYSGWEKDLLSN